MTGFHTVKRAWQVLLAAILGGALQAAAQEISGVVVNADGATPAAHAVVVLLHASRDSVLARAVTNDRGAYSIILPAATTVRLRVLRIGYQPMSVGTYSIGLNDVRTVSITLVDERVHTVSVDVTAKQRCDVRPDGAALVSQIFEQARTALYSSSANASNVSDRPESRFVNYTRTEDTKGRLQRPVVRAAVTGPSTRPFASRSADSLARFGYVIDDNEGSTMYAPDANVLVSEAFVGQHCLTLVPNNSGDSTLIGIGFRPATTRVGVVDVKGTLWIDRASYALQYLEYTYEPLSMEIQRAGVGGRVDYAQTAGGLWFVRAWSIRMPLIATRSAAFMGGIRGGGGSNSARVNGVQIIGGEVESIRSGDLLLFSNSAAVRAGDARRDLTVSRVTAGMELPIDLYNTDSAKAVRASRAAQQAIEDSAAEKRARRYAPIVPVASTDKRFAALYVTDNVGQPLPHASVMLNGGAARVTDDSGRVVLPTGGQNTINVDVRRMGFGAFAGRVTRTSAAQAFVITLAPSGNTLATVNVRDRIKTPLELTGFYERMREVQRGAVLGEFLTPEQIDARHTGVTSRLFTDNKYLRIDYNHGKPILRNTMKLGCPYAIFVDGHRMNGVLGSSTMPISLDIDAIVTGADVMAIEIYPTNSMPSAFFGLTGNGGCGAVAFWTGGRH